MIRNPVLREALDWLLHIAVAVVIGFLIVTFVAQRTIVYHHSMEPTLYEGDNLLVEKISPRLGKLDRGDIVVIRDASPTFTQEGKELIKRIIGIEGDSVELKDGGVYINGELLEEPYIKGVYTPPSHNPENNRLMVPEGCVFVLGDNRVNSIDSRSFGPVEIDKVEAKALIRIYPFNKAGVIK